MSTKQQDIEKIASTFCREHEVSIITQDIWPRLTGTWVIDGKETSYRGMRRLLVPIVLREIGYEPAAVKKIMWKIIVNIEMKR